MTEQENPETLEVPDQRYVLLKWAERRDASPDDVVVFGVFNSYADVVEKIERIRRANAQYPTKEIDPMNWRVGPDYDEGFFGNSPIRLRAVAK